MEMPMFYLIMDDLNALAQSDRYRYGHSGDEYAAWQFGVDAGRSIIVSRFRNDGPMTESEYDYIQDGLREKAAVRYPTRREGAFQNGVRAVASLFHRYSPKNKTK